MPQIRHPILKKRSIRQQFKYIIVKYIWMSQEEKKGPSVPKVQAVKFIERSNGTIKGYSVNTFHGLVKNYNEDRVSIIMNITKPNFKGRWPRCSYFGVFDGHGGNKCSDFLKQNMHKYITENSHFPHEPIQALKFGFKKAEQEFLSYAESQNPVQRSGSCAIVVLIIDQMCYIANVGDSRAILSANGGKSVYPISKDHKPDSETERERIYNAGGRIYQSSIKNKNGNIIVGPFRIEPGKLSVSRSFGDIEAKLPKYEGNPKVLIAKPEITYFEINSEEHDFVMICSDGVYDKLSNEEVSQCFWDTKDKACEEKEKYHFIGRVPSKVIQKSMESMSMDNLTSLIVVFEDQGRMMLPHKKSLKNTEKQSVRRPQSSMVPEVENKKLQKRNENLSKNELISFATSSRVQKLGPVSEKNREANQENRDHNRQMNRRQSNEQGQKMVKRKSTTNILSNTLEKKSDQLHHGLHSLNNSVSAKMLLAGSKALQKIKIKDSGDKVSINDLIQKKKSSEHIRKDKDNIWKNMMNSKGNDLKEKMIRF